MPSTRLALLAALVSFGLARTAAAQTITIGATVTRTHSDREQDQQPTWVNHADCVGVDGDPDHFVFNITHTGAFGMQFEVWAGSVDCFDDAQRTGANATCWQVYSATAGDSPMNVVVSSRDIVGQHTNQDSPSGPGSGTLADCDEGSDAPTTISLYFMVTSGGHVVGTGATYATAFDTIGPPPPSGISTGIGEDLLYVKWSSASTSSGLLGYIAYCDPKPGASPPTSTPAAAGAPGLDGSAGAAEAAAGGASGAAGSAGASTADASTDGGATDGGGGSTGNSACPSTALIEGEIPDPAYQCGQTSSKIATKVAADGLTNFVTYAVAVAAVDNVGNAGQLSPVVCGRPEPIDDFYELYTRAGGKGGGGFCAIGADPSQGILALLGTTLVAWFLRRRRRG